MRGCGEVGVAVEQGDVGASLEQQSYGGFWLGLGDVQAQVPVGAFQGFAERGGQGGEGAGEAGEVEGAGRLPGAGV